MSSRSIAAALAVLLSIILLLNLRSLRSTGHVPDTSWRFEFSRDANSHSLSETQCNAAFPRLFENIDDAVSARTRNKDWVKPEELEIPAGRCMLRVLIYEGELRVVDLGKPEDCYVSNGRERIMATLSLIQRALASAPTTEPIPNIEFPISYDDMPTRSTHGVSWGFTRKQDEQNVWLIPDYGYWSWWAVGIPSLRSVWRRVQELEQSLKWQQKIPKAIWRGTTHLNPVIRDRLVDTAEATTWGDVQRTSKGEEDNNWLTLDAHCKYQFVLQAEGTSYSGRLKFLQLCKSVTVAHRMEWAEFATHLMRADGPEQNFIKVKQDWSDLAQKMEYYIHHSKDAEAIATRSYEVFNQRYLTPAAVSCYLRRLFYGWAKVQGFNPEISHNGSTDGYDLRGIPFEALAVSFPQERPGEYGRFAPG